MTNVAAALNILPKCAPSFLGSNFEIGQRGHGESGSSFPFAAPLSGLQSQRLGYKSRFGSGSVKVETMPWTGQRRLAVKGLLSFSRSPSSGRGEDRSLGGRQLHQDRVLRTEEVAFPQQAYRISPAGLVAAEMLCQVRYVGLPARMTIIDFPLRPEASN